jgi:hypothetical protein
MAMTVIMPMTLFPISYCLLSVALKMMFFHNLP